MERFLIIVNGFHKALHLGCCSSLKSVSVEVALDICIVEEIPLSFFESAFNLLLISGAYLTACLSDLFGSFSHPLPKTFDYRTNLIIFKESSVDLKK